jgi:hypothetical protein
MKKYREYFDHLGNPHYVKVDWDGVFIVIGMVALIMLISTLGGCALSHISQQDAQAFDEFINYLQNKP